jgi:transketolase
MSNRRELANAIRFLSMDAVQAANSGHPGAPMGMADIAEVLWNDYLVHNPQDPQWLNRDRFVLSNGHGSMLLYSLLHLTGYDLGIEELKNFRQMGSRTPGHPEYGYAPGVETTTGPLGQGLANAVGMALAEKVLASHYNKSKLEVVDHQTYVFAGDGCLMEGISHEVCSLAGTWSLGKLIVFYDDNQISIDGEVSGWFTDKTAKRFEAYGWQVIPKIDGHDSGAIRAAIETAKADTDRPTLICCRTTIGYGAPNKQGSADTHGAPLGDDEIAAARKELGWPYESFEIPQDIYQAWDAKEEGVAAQSRWQDVWESYSNEFPDLASELSRRLSGELPEGFDKIAEEWVSKSQREAAKIATRKASQNCLEALAPGLPELIGGSADLSGSNNTKWNGCRVIDGDEADGNYIHYGVREFGMAAIANGMALHGGFIPYAGTFLVFMDYARNAVRMAALMRLQSIFVFSHDSIGLGEDGPTHQPIEHLTTLRVTPNMHTWRPCDSAETAVAWKSAIQYQDGPSALILSRQGLPCAERSEEVLANASRGGYTLLDCDGQPDAIILATGSEVSISLQAAEQLAEQRKKVRVVSLPCVELFMSQSEAYRESVLPNQVRARVAVEAAHPDYWYKLVGLEGRVIGIDRFGESAPGPELMEHFGFTADNVVHEVTALLGA